VAGKHDSLRSRLESEKKTLTGELELLHAAAALKDERREGSPFGKREEEATESLELERRLALEKQILEHLVEVEAALGKFDEDSYGRCENCGKPIEPARLEALPQAKLCLNCKSLQGGNARVRPSAG
jgi:RNA polymerase-binding transcription factor DksA